MVSENPGTHRDGKVVVSTCGERIINYGLPDERVEPSGLFSDLLDPDKEFELRVRAKFIREMKAAGLEQDSIED